MGKEAAAMLRQVLKGAKKPEDFATIQRIVDEARAQARAQPEYWRVALPGQVKGVTFPDFGLPVFPMQVIALELDKEEMAGDE
jgi:hypothetical protein